MLGDYGEVLVMDWGLAKVLGATAPGVAASARDRVAGDASRSRDDDDVESHHGRHVMGTPQYMCARAGAGRSRDARRSAPTSTRSARSSTTSSPSARRSPAPAPWRSWKSGARRNRMGLERSGCERNDPGIPPSPSRARRWHCVREDRYPSVPASRPRSPRIKPASPPWQKTRAVETVRPFCPSQSRREHRHRRCAGAIGRD